MKHDIRAAAWTLALVLSAAGCGRAPQPVASTDSPLPADVVAPLDDGTAALPDPVDTAPARAVDWHHFVWLEAGFSVELPLNVWTNHPGDTPGSTPANVFLVRAFVPDLVTFYCMTNTLADEAPELTPAQRLLAAQQRAMQNVEGKLLVDRAFEMDGHPAREFILQLPNNMLLCQRLILADGRLHQLMAELMSTGAALEDFGNPQIERFFSSYRLLPGMDEE